MPSLISYTLHGTIKFITLGDCVIVPSFGRNVISEHKFIEKGCKIVKDKNLTRIIARHGAGPLLIEAPIVNRLYFLPDAKAAVPEQVNLARQYRSTDLSDLQLAHQRLGHINFRDVARLTESKTPEKTPFCEACVQGKSTRHPIGARSSDLPPLHDAVRPGYLLHADHMGPFRVSTRSGKKYALLFVDEYLHLLFH